MSRLSATGPRRSSLRRRLRPRENAAALLRGARACLALLAAAALLALAAPAQAQTEVWSATLTTGDLSSGILGCSNGVGTARCSSTSVLSEDSFTYDSTAYNITGLFVRSNGQLEFIVDVDLTTTTLADLTLVVGSTSLVLSGGTASGTVKLIFSSSGVSLTAGTDITVKLTAPGTPNTAATGAPTITGTVQVGKTLTAVTTGITDADGLTSPTYTYQWIRVDGTDEEDISGENSSTYTLVDADLGKTIKVKVSFTDDASNAETLTSAATATVAADTTPPEVVSVTVNSTGATVTLVFDEHLDDAAAGGLHLSAISLTAGGQAVTASFADFNLQRQTLALTYRYGTIKQGQTVVFSYTDPTAGDDTDTLQDVAGNDVASFTTGMSGVPAVTNNSTNNAATGEPAITGTAQVGQELTADASSIMDTDGLTAVDFTYQWLRVDEDGTSNEEDISGEIAETYTLTDDDVGKKVKVKVGFTDELNGEEERTSAAYPSSGTVTAAGTTNTAPTAANKTVTTGEDRPYTFEADDFGFMDADTGDTLASVKIVTVPALGTLALDGTAVLADGVVTEAQIDGDMLTFTPARDAHGDSYTTFTFKVNDGTVDSASAYTMTIDVTDAPLPVCGVPDIAGAGRRQIWTGTVTVEAFDSLGRLAGYGFDEVLSAGTLLPSQSFSIGSNDYMIKAIEVTLAGDLFFSLDRLEQLTDRENVALRLHVCDGDYDFNNPSASDQTDIIWNTTLDWSHPVVTRTVYLSLPANNAATGEPAITGTARAEQVLTADASPIMDTDGLPSSFTYQWVRVDADGTSNPVDITDANAETYTLTDDDEGKKVKVKVSFTDELSGEEERTSAAYPSSGTVTAAGPNTAPTAANNTVTTAEDRPYAFDAGDFGFVDTDTGDTLASVKIVTPPALGTLALADTAVLADAVVTKAQIDADMLTFRPAHDAHGDPYTTFTFKVNDGTDDSADAYTMTIEVTDAPAPVCTAPSFGDRREIWSGTVTVERGESSGTVYYAFIEGVEGTLLPSQSFSIGSNNYVIDAILVGVEGTMEFSIGGFDEMTFREVVALRLNVCDGDYDFGTADDSFDVNTTTWLRTTLDWSPPVVTRTVYLSLPANNAATGEPAITGTAQAGQALTADASPIMDTDGLTGVDFTYQWLRVDADGTSNPADITDATAATYTLTAADAGKKVKVKVSFTDELSGEEERTSAAYPSSGTVTASANTTAPMLTSVTVTSTPRKTTDTYGAREHIEFTMTFDAPVTVTGDPTFDFDLGGPSTATWYAGSGTATLRFSHAVSGGASGDRDTNGISWAMNAIELNGGAIAGTDNAVTAILTHAAQSNLAGHKVDGRTTAVTPATVTDVVVTSTPMSMASGSTTADTYGFGETIVITVTASEAVEVVGDPEFKFSLSDMGGPANDVPATYDRTRSSPTTIVFTYTVQAGDRDNNGIWIGDHSRTFMLDANDRIRTASQQIDIDRSHPEKSTHTGHKVDGSLGAPTVPPDPTAPTLVSATATTLTIEWTHPGDGGSPLTRNFVHYRVEGTTDWTNWYAGETPVTRAVITNLEAETAYDVRVHSSNAIGNSHWAQSATAFSTLAGTAATGAPAITGTAAVGQVLAVDLTGIEDADGLTNVSYSYQWVRVDADGLSNPADIADATDATYTVVYADLGKTLKVRVTFDDDAGNTETLTSDATVTVTPAAGAPSSPNNLSATVGVGQVVLVWQHTSGGGTRSSYEYRSSPGDMIAPDAMWQQVLSSPGRLNQAYYQVVKGLTSDTPHTLQVRAANAQGGSAPATVTATPVSQPSCTIDALGDRRLLWQGQLTAEIREIHTDGNIWTGYGTGGVETGTLTPDAFTFRSTSYSVYPRTYDDFLNVLLREQDIDVWYPRDEVVDALRLHVCNTPYDFSSAAVPPDVFASFRGYRWSVGSNWPPGIERTLRLSLPPNHPATGDPVISGTVQVGAELTALTDGIMDDDVLDDVFTYQWVRVDADGTSNEADITDATDATYTLTDDERGKKVKVEVRFVDILGGKETRTSAPTETLPGVTVSKTALTVTEEDTTGASYTVVLNSQPTANVTVTVAGHAGTDVTLTPSSATLTFTTMTWGTAQTVTVTAGDDADTANDEVTLTHSAASTDSEYQGISIAGVAVTVTDNDAPPGVTVSTTALTVTEEDTTGARYTVVLNSQPTATVTVTVAGHAGTDVSLTPSSATLTFTPMNWGTAQTVTVTAGPDADTANDTVTLTHSAASTDSDYQGITIAGVTVTVTDNDDNDTAPGAPRDLGTTPGDGRVTLAWTAPGSDGGAAIEKYRYRVSANAGSSWDPDWTDVPDGADAGDSAADETTFTVSGLSNGTEYVFELRAVNSVGEGPAASAADTPVRAPLPPGSGFLVGNFGQPPDDDDAQIFNTQDILGVFTAGAQGATLDSIEFRLSTVLTNATVELPSATLYGASVTGARVTRGDQVAVLTAEPGAPGATAEWQTIAFDAPSGTRLAAGATYLVVLSNYTYVSVEMTTYPAEDAGGAPGWAIDGIGAGNNSPYSYRTTASLLMRVNGTAAGAPVATAPDAPASLGAAAGNARVRLIWTPPRRDGGAGIEKYQVRYSAGSRVDPETGWTDVPDGSDSGTSRADERLVSVTELDNGRQYAFELRAVNGVRAGAAATATATPAAPPRTGFLVSNFGRPVDGAAQIYVTKDIVGVFTTGTRGGALDSIELRLDSRTPEIAQHPSATLYRGSVTGTRATPGTRVATLTAKPGSPRPAASAETITFTAPGGTRLEAGATYLVVLEASSGYVGVQYTNASAQDAGGASGWTIDGVGAGNSSPWSYGTSDSLLMSVNGTTVAAARQTVREEEDEQEEKVAKDEKDEKAAKDEEEPEEQEPATTPDPDRGISLSTSSSSAIEGEAVTISVRRAGPTDRATSVAVQVLDSALTDAWSIDLDFRAGAATATDTVWIPFDGARPASRTVTVRLASVEEPYSVGSPSTLTFNVTERDAALSVADASVSEGPGATLAFAVTLDRTRDSEVRVKYATSDGTATQGEDYTGVSGTLRFAPGETSKTVSVAVLDDAHDEGSETLILTLSSPRRAVITDASATGTIDNSDPLPKGWLARFGRTSATQVLGLLDARFDEARAPASQLTLGGHPIKLSGPGGNPQGGADPSGGPVAPLTPDGDSRGTSDAGNGSVATHTDRAAVPHTAGGPADLAGEPAVAPADPFDALASRYTLDAAARDMADLHNDPVAMHADPAATPDPAAGAGGEATLLERLAWRLLTRGGWSVDRRQFLSHSSFDLSLSALGRETDGEVIETARVRETPGHWSLWGRGVLTRFAGQDTGISLDGDVLTGLLGLDYSRGRWLAGLGLAYNDGDGAYRAPGSGTAGKLDSTLVSVHPYLHYALTDRLSAWGTLGYGAGGLRLRPERDGAKAQDTIKTDIQMRMGALGLRGAVFANATTELALKSDLMWVRTASSATEGLAAVDAADASRVRLLLTGRHRHMLATGAALTPNVELGLRYDDGAAETGAGVELGGGLRYADPARGLTVEATARALLAHEDGGYEEWGLSGSLQLDPGRLGRGLSLRLASGWGLTDSGTETLWQQQTASGLTRGAGQTSRGRIKAEWAYGLDVPWTHGLLTPYGSVEMAGGGGRTLALGWRFELGQSLSLSLNGERREALHVTPEHALMLQTTLPW